MGIDLSAVHTRRGRKLHAALWLLLAVSLALATLASIALSPVAHAAGNTATVICADGESSLQAAFDQAVSGTPLTISVNQANCQMSISDGIVMGAGLDITLYGNGLVLDGGGYSGSSGTTIIDIEDSTNSPSTLNLNQITFQNSYNGIAEDPIEGSDFAATVNLAGCTISKIGWGLYPAVANIKDSTFTDNGYATDLYAGTVDGSTFTDNSYAVWVQTDIGKPTLYPGDVTVSNSTFTGNYYAVDVGNNAIVSDSTITGSDAYGIWAVSTTVSGSTFSDNSEGVFVYFATVSDSEFHSNDFGIEVYANDGVIGDANVQTSTFTGNGCGIAAEILSEGGTTYSATAEVSGSDFDSNTRAIYGGDDKDCTQGTGIGVHATVAGSSGPGSRPAPGQNSPTGKHSTASGGVTSQSATPLVKPASAVVPETISLTDSAITNTSLDGIHTSENVTVSNSTISGSGGNGVTAGSATVANSTITGNGTSSPANGVTASDNLTASFSTIAGNSGNGLQASDNMTLTADILANNEGPNCTGGAEEPNVTDNGYNLSTDDTCHLTADSQANVSPADLNLQDLANNNGPLVGASTSPAYLQTMALGSGSVAIDAVPVNGSHQCVDANSDAITDPATGDPITTDERGVTRPQGPKCDAGAFEVAVSNQVVTLPGYTNVVRQGYYALVRIAVENPNGQNISSRNLAVTSVELDGPNGQTIAFSHPFQFGRFSGTKGYQLSINTRNLARGDWTLVVQVGSGKNATTSTVGFTVE